MSDTRRLLIKYTDPQEPDEIVEIPDSWKVTFGPWSPRAGQQQSTRTFPAQNELHNKPGWILRVYETKEKQRAVFTNVESFRDLGVPLFRRKIVIVPMGTDEMVEEAVSVDMKAFEEVI